MQIEAWGLRSWQWLFIIEGVPSILLGIAVLFIMTDRPSKARWLAPEQRAWLERTLLQERDELEAVHGTMSVWRALIEPRVLALCLIYIGFGTISCCRASCLARVASWSAPSSSPRIGPASSSSRPCEARGKMRVSSGAPRVPSLCWNC